MKESPLVSIITPCYNASAYLPETINSILAQSYQNWEWLIVDDCSKDDSYKLLQEASKLDGRIKVLQNSINEGAYAARNLGLEHAQGEYIAFIDADDLWSKDKLLHQLNFMEQKSCFFSYTAFTRFKETVDDHKKISVPSKTSYYKLLTNTVIATSTVMVNVQKIGTFKMEDVYYDDFVLWLQLLKRVKFAYGLNQPLTNYRISTNSLSRNKLHSAKKVYAIFVNNLHFGFFKSRFYFSLWAINAVLRYMRY